MTAGDGERDRPSASDRLFAGLQWLLPTRLLSCAMHGLAASRRPWLKNLLIGRFQRLYDIDLGDAETTDARRYPSFNAFFTRALQAHARPLPEAGGALACPVDGQLGVSGTIEEDQLLQAKGARYRLGDLLHGKTIEAPFLSGAYATLYLAPHHYHRVHMPIVGTLRETRYLPGRLFGVNPASVRAIPRLFTRNERLVCLFDTAVGPMAMVLVGAFCVGGLETVWSGTVTPPHRGPSARHKFPAAGAGSVRLERGDELGRFNLGSTVLLLFGDGAVTWDDELRAGDALRMGQSLGTMNQRG